LKKNSKRRKKRGARSTIRRELHTSCKHHETKTEHGKVGDFGGLREELGVTAHQEKGAKKYKILIRKTRRTSRRRDSLAQNQS